MSQRYGSGIGLDVERSAHEACLETAFLWQSVTRTCHTCTDNHRRWLCITNGCPTSSGGSGGAGTAAEVRRYHEHRPDQLAPTDPSPSTSSSSSSTTEIFALTLGGTRVKLDDRALREQYLVQLRQVGCIDHSKVE